MKLTPGESHADDRPHAITLQVDDAELEGELAVPHGAEGLVIFAHGSGSSHLSPRNRLVARQLREAGLGTLLTDLLTGSEELEDARSGHLRFDIEFLARRLEAVTLWADEHPALSELHFGYFGASTGAAAALVAAARIGSEIEAVVSRGGRPDLAADALSEIQAPTLLIVGERDEYVLELNRRALEMLGCERKLCIVPGATHLFEESGALEDVATLAAEWFLRNLSDVE